MTEQVAEFVLLAEVDYNDGLPSEAQTWTYDAASNRTTDSVQGSGRSCDSLIRAGGLFSGFRVTAPHETRGGCPPTGLGGFPGPS
ncbi:MAG: hypothetical protein HND43_08755 [Armatimonadetes bacterium]|nr:hypothetical protein [Armatimonadota bacterium]NOG39465.1 hypothetical protein [Armatimonadota bacterium]GIK31321.1 MAG: hypothetical protein BroJett009_03130 [Armatimonadota bacterium]